MNLTYWLNSLRVQIVGLLTLALLPIGAVAVYQTTRVKAEAEYNGQLALLSLTARTAKAEELLLEGAFGVARFFAAVAPDFLDNPERCLPELSQFIESNPSYSFIGVLPRSGLMTCSSSEAEYDFSGWEGFDRAFDAAVPTVVVNETAPLSGQSVFVVSYPYFEDELIQGFVSVSVPHSGLPDAADGLEDLGLAEVITFNADESLLTARGGLSEAAGELPADRDLVDFNGTEPTVFESISRNGDNRIYTVVPVVGSPVTVMGVWKVDRGLGSRIGAFLSPSLFPILMWLASMAVAILSIYTLVLRHMTRLRESMDNFAEHRLIEEPDAILHMPNELAALSGNFLRMTDDILREEAALENSVREKNVLIKEVHHRVKNNLQLISSIMNMQIRTAEHDETRTVLSSIQDRVISLATIHRDLYQSQNGGMVDVGALVTEIVDKTVEVATSNPDYVKVDIDIDQVWLYPDQAVPLSLMVAEAMTNMMKYLGAAEGNTPWVKVSLHDQGGDCVVVLANSVGADNDEAESTGVGAQLINAFSIQLGGTIDTVQADNSYTITVVFKISEFVPDTRDF